MFDDEKVVDEDEQPAVIVTACRTSRRSRTGASPLCGNRGLIIQTIATRQYNACSPRQQRLAPRPMRHRLKPAPLFLRQYQRFFGSSGPHLRLLYSRRITA
jgi:hypothetical protein